MSKALIRCGLTVLLAIAVSGCASDRMGLPGWNPLAKRDAKPTIQSADFATQSPQSAERRFTGSNAENVADVEASVANLRHQMAADARPADVDWKVRGRRLPQSQPPMETAAAMARQPENTTPTADDSPAWWGNEHNTAVSESPNEPPFAVASTENSATVNPFASSENEDFTPPGNEESIQLVGGQREEYAAAPPFRGNDQRFRMEEPPRSEPRNNWAANGNSGVETAQISQETAGNQPVPNLPHDNVRSEYLPPRKSNTPPIADPAEQGQILYQAGDFAGAERNFRAIDLTALPARDRLPIQYLIGNCLKKQGKPSEAAIWYQKVAQAGIDDVLVEQARWNLNNGKLLPQAMLDSANSANPMSDPGRNPFVPD